MKRFNATTQTWESFASSQFTQFEPGVGYNIIGLTTASFDYGETETTTTFIYDSTGARVKKTAGGETAIYLGKDYEVDNVTIKHIFLGDRRITTKKSSGEISYIHDDHISSSNVVTDAAGNQSAMYEYDPYGATVTHTGAVDLKHQFTGQEKDDSTGLHYYNARYYDSQLGRFITADPTIQHPTDPQDFNRYAYARNNPIRFIDPTGLGWFSKLFAVIAAVVTLPFTAGQSAWIIIGVAALAGAAGGLAGAAIAKENLLRGALEGAAIGAAVGTGASLAQGASGGGGNLAGYRVTDVEMVTGYTEGGQAVMQSYTIVQPIVTETTSPLIPNIIGATTASGHSLKNRDVPKSRAGKSISQSALSRLDSVIISGAGHGPGQPFANVPTGGGVPVNMGGGGVAQISVNINYLESVKSGLQVVQEVVPETLQADHNKPRPSTEEKHEKGKRRKGMDKYGGEKGDKRRTDYRNPPPRGPIQSPRY